MIESPQLHELATKKGVEVDFRFLEPFNFNFHKAMRMWKKDEMRGNYTVNLTVAGHEFIGKADLPQMAKHHAAEQAMPVLQQGRTQFSAVVTFHNMYRVIHLQ